MHSVEQAKHLMLLLFENWLGKNKNSVPNGRDVFKSPWAGWATSGRRLWQVCARGPQHPTQNSLGSTFVPWGLLPDLLVCIKEVMTTTKGVRLWELPHQRPEIPALQSLVLGLI